MPVPFPAILLPDAPVIVAGVSRAAVLSPDGEVSLVPLAAAAAVLRRQPAVVCHGPALVRRLGGGHHGGGHGGNAPVYDVLELFAFVRPAQFCLPTPRGLADALGQPVPVDLAEEAVSLLQSVNVLLQELTQFSSDALTEVAVLAQTLARADWAWAEPVLAALPAGLAETPPPAGPGLVLQVWRKLPQWSADAPEPPPATATVEPGEARRRLAQLLGSQTQTRPRKVEPRPQQADYADALTHAFAPRDQVDTPNLVLAEAGTGVGKTLGYLAPSTVWAEKAGAPVWISTYTRNLQHQIDHELDNLFQDAPEKIRRVVLRKGRENYLCLLNFEEAVRRVTLDSSSIPVLALMARWIRATRDGDLQGSDFPGWLVDLRGRELTVGLADRRGECIFSACEHYHRCFIERSVRRARRADIVIANHALVMIQAAQGGGDDGRLPLRYVFDEGHHLFDAADSAFSAHLTGLESQELRRWLLGAESEGRGGRARGLKRRLEDVVAPGDPAAAALEAVLAAARGLPGESWRTRVAGGEGKGPTEKFLHRVRQQVLARASGVHSAYSLECDIHPPGEGVVEAAAALGQALDQLLQPLRALAACLTTLLDDESAELESDQRRRIDALARGLTRRADQTVLPWKAMVASLGQPAPVGFVDWFGLERMEGREVDVGMYRHMVDPSQAFARTVLTPSHGAVVTSATLMETTGEAENDWLAAEERVGTVHLPHRPLRVAVPSPFDYARCSRVLVVNDVRKDDLGQVAAAYRELFLAAGGGGLGLFTAITRLRAVHGQIGPALEAAGLPLYAQHVDGLDVSTLIDIFRAEEHACLLGTDAVRDGVDVPGRSLRLIVFDRVPWPRPDILHRARRAAFGGKRYDDRIVRLRLRQAFGRLIRRADDTGVFVLLDPLMPTRLSTAFPQGTVMQRVGLAEAVRQTREFLEPGGVAGPLTDKCPEE